jgi:hypothetical protein
VASIPDPPDPGGGGAGPEGGGEYEIDGALREGWGGTIRSGRYLRSGRRVTVEEIRSDLVASPGLIERLGQIGREASGLRDPHLLAVYDLVDNGGALSLIAEWSDAPTLASVLRRGALPPERAVPVVDSILAGLEALHGAGLFHGNVGPETVVVEEGGARLAELAVSAAAAPPGAGSDADVRDAARLGLHLLRGAGGRLDPVRRPLESATAGGSLDAAGLRAALAAGASAALGSGWRDPPAAPPRRRRRRRALLVLLALVVAAGAAAAAAVLLLQPSHSTAVAPGPLVIGSDASVTVNAPTGGCDTTFSFLARGSLSGVGSMVYRWEQSDGQVTDDVTLHIVSSEGSFELAEAWRLQGSQTVNGTMTLHLLQPVDRKIGRSFHYACP